MTLYHKKESIHYGALVTRRRVSFEELCHKKACCVTRRRVSFMVLCNKKESIRNSAVPQVEEYPLLLCNKKNSIHYGVVSQEGEYPLWRFFTRRRLSTMALC